jgi:hypothetical protein
MFLIFGSTVRLQPAGDRRTSIVTLIADHAHASGSVSGGDSDRPMWGRGGSGPELGTVTDTELPFAGAARAKSIWAAASVAGAGVWYDGEGDGLKVLELR